MTYFLIYILGVVSSYLYFRLGSFSWTLRDRCFAIIISMLWGGFLIFIIGLFDKINWDKDVWW